MRTGVTCPECGKSSELDTEFDEWRCYYCNASRKLDMRPKLTYDYKVVYLGNTPQEKLLNDLGAQGWKLIAVTYISYGVFMREAQ